MVEPVAMMPTAEMTSADDNNQSSNPGFADQVQAQIVNERVESVTHSQHENSESMGMPQNSSTSARQVMDTEQGLVNKDAVQAMRQAHISPDAPLIKNISSNQSQEYFAVATQTGFEII